MKKLLTAIALATSIVSPVSASSLVGYDTTPVFDNHGDEVKCFRWSFRDYDNQTWNTPHAYNQFNANIHTDNKLYLYENGDLFIVARSDEFTGSYAGKERWNFQGNLNQGWHCGEFVFKNLLVSHSDDYIDKTTLYVTTIPGTNCSAILKKPERLPKPRLYAVENTPECEDLKYGGFFEGQQRQWLATYTYGFEHILNRGY